MSGVLLGPVVLNLGSESSTPDTPSGGAIEVILRYSVSQLSTEPPRVRILLLNTESQYPSVHTSFIVEGEATGQYLVDNPPRSYKVRVECTRGSAVVAIGLGDRDLPTKPGNLQLTPGSVLWVGADGTIKTLDPPPPAGYYFGTDRAGEVGYHPLGNGGFMDHFHVWQEVPIGSVDGSNREFRIDNAPLVSSLQVFKNGLMMAQGIDYEFLYTTITFHVGQTPHEGDNILVNYVIPL
jgi:hypothetical protein